MFAVIFGGIWMYFYDFVVFLKFFHTGIYHIRPATTSEGWFPPWSTYQHFLQDTLQNDRELCWQEASPGSWEEAHHHVWYISQYHIQSSSIISASDIHFSKRMRPDDWGTTHKNSPHFCGSHLWTTALPTEYTFLFPCMFWSNVFFYCMLIFN